MSDDAWNRFRPSKDNKGAKQPTKIGWKSSASPKKPQPAPSKAPDLFSIWDDQRSMDAEEKKMAKELAETKKKARELQKTLRKHQFGETKVNLEGKSKVLTEKANDYLGRSKTWVLSHKKLISGLTAGFIAIVVVFNVFGPGSNSDQTGTLGDTTPGLVISEDLPREQPDFPILYPGGKSSKDYDTVRISPDGSAPSYTYLDKLTEEGKIFKVTQQEVPENFDLSKVATEFQATSVIQIDDDTVYHGYSEKGGIQSLVFIKDGKLISIRSPQKFTDDQWAAYIISLK